MTPSTTSTSYWTPSGIIASFATFDLTSPSPWIRTEIIESFDLTPPRPLIPSGIFAPHAACIFDYLRNKCKQTDQFMNFIYFIFTPQSLALDLRRSSSPQLSLLTRQLLETPPSSCWLHSTFEARINHRGSRGIRFDSTESYNFLTFHGRPSNMIFSTIECHWIIALRCYVNFFFSLLCHKTLIFKIVNKPTDVYNIDDILNKLFYFNKSLNSLWNYRAIRDILLDSIESLNSLCNLRAPRWMYFDYLKTM